MVMFELVGGEHGLGIDGNFLAGGLHDVVEKFGPTTAEMENAALRTTYATVTTVGCWRPPAPPPLTARGAYTGSDAKLPHPPVDGTVTNPLRSVVKSSQPVPPVTTRNDPDSSYWGIVAMWNLKLNAEAAKKRMGGPGAVPARWWLWSEFWYLVST